MTGREYPPAVYWMPKRVRDALMYQAAMEGIAAQPVADDGGESPVAQVTPEHLAPVKRTPPEASVMPGQIFPPDTDQSSSKRRFLAEDRGVVDEYHDAAVMTGANYLCRNPNCLHLAPVPGDPCPVCADKGWRAITDPAGDAA